MQIRLFVMHGVIAIVWAAAFSTVSDSLTTSTKVLLVLCPLIDLVARAI